MFLLGFGAVNAFFPQQRSDGVFSPWVLERVPEGVAERVVPDRVPERVPEQVPEQVPERVPEQVPERVPERRVPEQVPEQVPERVPEQVPEQVPERVPERVRERVPERVREQVLGAGSGAGSGRVPFRSRSGTGFGRGPAISAAVPERWFRFIRDVSCGFVWPTWYQKMFHVVSRGQCGTRNVSYSFVQSVGISRYFTRFRVAWHLRCVMWFRVAS